MARLIFENLSLQQAMQLAEWFEGQGQGDSAPWLTQNYCTPVKVDRVEDWRRVVNGDVVVKCKKE